jgi:signal transduction histidine kinase
METTFHKTHKSWVALGMLVTLAVLFLLSQQNFLLFHALAELFSVIVAAAVFVLVWNARPFLTNGYLLLLGVALLFIAGIDTLHTLAYKNMGVFPANDANLPTQLWLAGRYMQAGTFLIAPFFIKRKVHLNGLLAAYSLVTALLLLSIFAWGIFPDAFIEGSGLTAFKISSEYVIILALAASALMLARFRQHFEERVLRLLLLAIAISAISEAAFTLYQDVFGLWNVMGHFLKIVTFFLIYRAIVVTGLVQPISLLFRDLQQREAELRAAHDKLEERVRQRTAEVVAANLALQAEVEEHERAEAELRRYRERLEELVAARTAELEKEIQIRRRAEADTRHYASQLERSNRDLQDFAFIASHDLQEPLRKIQAFGERLENRLGDRLEPKEQDFLRRMRDAASRMQVMISGLLDYSRVSSKGRPYTSVNLTKIAKEVVSDLVVRLEQTQGSVEVGSLPTIEADPLQMRQLIQNLVSNALKFHRPGVPPKVCLSSQVVTADPPQVEIKIEDNGIGFSEQDGKNLFQPFHRLVSRSEYEGSGIGLAICRKIVERHRGIIQVQSQPGQGSTFTITLPLEQPAMEPQGAEAELEQTSSGV